MIKTLVAICVAIGLFMVYVMVIHGIAEKKLNDYEEKRKEIGICEEGDWLNWSHYNETSGNYTYFEEGIYRCGFDKFEACQMVNGSNCTISKIFEIEVRGIAGEGIVIQEFSLGHTATGSHYRPPRWYGSFEIQSTKQGSNVYVYLFQIDSFKLPIMIQDDSWWKYHYAMFGTLIFGILITSFIELLIYLNKKETNNNGESYIDFMENTDERGWNT